MVSCTYGVLWVRVSAGADVANLHVHALRRYTSTPWSATLSLHTHPMVVMQQSQTTIACTLLTCTTCIIYSPFRIKITLVIVARRCNTTTPQPCNKSALALQHAKFHLNIATVPGNAQLCTYLSLPVESVPSELGAQFSHVGQLDRRRVFNCLPISHLCPIVSVSFPRIVIVVLRRKLSAIVGQRAVAIVCVRHILGIAEYRYLLLPLGCWCWWRLNFNIEMRLAV